MQTLIESRVPVGRIKTFGAVGPKYVVGKPLRQLEDGDWLVEIVLLESSIVDETVEYRLSSVEADPDAP